VNIEHIRTFLEIAATGNFKQAAKRLNVTQSTVSARIKVLEEQLDRPLFVRHRYGVSLTVAGRHFQRHAEASVRSWMRARQEVSLPEGFQTVIGIGASFTLYDRLLSGWTTRMRIKRPDVALRVTVDFSEGLNNNLVDGIIDIGVMYQPRNAPGLISEHLMADELVLASTRPPPMNANWIDDYILVDWGIAFLDEHARAFPHMEAPAISMGLEDLALRHILKHGGSGYFARHRVQPLFEQNRLYPVAETPIFKRPSYVVYSASPADEELMKLALQELKAVVNEKATTGE
jgi:DNA-binding transcriptional LysR family regulator